VTARQLLAWDALDRRRRAGRGGLRVVVTGLAAAGLIAAIGRGADTAEARRWWLLACGIGAALVPMGAPWRFYWRADSTLLARLPIPGEALYRLGAARGARTAAAMFAVLALAALPALLVDATLFARALALAALVTTVGTLLAPVTALLAGLLVVSEGAQEAFDNMTGAGGAPSVVWLSLVPAAGGCLLAVLPYVLVAETLGPPLLVAGGALLASGLLVVTGLPLSRRVLPEATREIAALDQVRLAHVELDLARGLEPLVARAAGAGRAILLKDVALARRRFPSYYLWLGAAVVALWGIAFTVEEPARMRWVLGLAAGMAAYTVLLARRLVRPPVERPRLLRILPFPAGAPARAKLVYLGWRALAPLALGLAPAVARAPAPLLLAALGAGLALATLLLGALVMGDSEP